MAPPRRLALRDTLEDWVDARIFLAVFKGITDHAVTLFW